MKYLTSKVLVIGFLALIATLVILTRISRPKPSNQLRSSPSPTPAAAIPAPAALDVPVVTNGAKTPTQFTITAKSIQTPNKLPTYRSYVKKLPLAKIASTFGFKTAPDQKQEQTQLFDQKVGRLKINQLTGHIFFESAREIGKSTIPPSREDVEVLGIKILSDLELTSTSLQPFLQDMDLYMTNGYNLAPGSSSRANFAIASFALKLNEQPLYLDVPTLQASQISVDADKNIRKLSAFAPPNLTEEGVKGLYSDSEARQALSAGKGSLVKASPKVFTEITIDPAFSSATISEVKLIYTQIKGEVLPAFEFSGTALDDRNKREFFVTYLVGAAKE